MSAARALPPNAGKALRQGFSLVEMLIALAAGLIVSGAAIAFLLSSFKSNADYVQSTRLTQELRNSLDLVTREIRRAGYDENSLHYLASGEGSPFLPLVLSSEISPSTAPKSYQCVIYRYDRAVGPAGPGSTPNTGGTLDPANGEVRGLRRVEAEVNGRTVGVIELAESSATSLSPSCDDDTANYDDYPPACNGAWCALSDPRVLNITQLAFTDNRTLVGTAPNQIQVRDIGISVQGQLAGSAAYTRGVRSRVRVRSDCFLPTLSQCNAPP